MTGEYSELTAEEFAKIVSEDELVREPLETAAIAFRTGRLGVVEGAALVLLFPVARYVVVDIGLPWLHSAARYAELWRLKFDSWVDTQYATHGRDKDEARRAGNVLRRELEEATGADAQQSWERLAGLLGAKPDAT